MMMYQGIPLWALDKASQSINYDDWENFKDNVSDFIAITGTSDDIIIDDETPAVESIKAHARTIAKYEKPPVCPDLLAARELACYDGDMSRSKSFVELVKAGQIDDGRSVSLALAGIKRGRELERRKRKEITNE